MEWIEDDGGRKAAGYKGTASDCAVRAIAIATELPYREVYDGINEVARRERRGKRKRGISNARSGVYTATIRKYLASLGWTWVPCMKIGTGCTVHFTRAELPTRGRIIVSLSKHLTAVVDGVCHDTSNPSRCTNVYGPDNKIVRSYERCVYGYWYK